MWFQRIFADFDPILFSLFLKNLGHWSDIKYAYGDYFDAISPFLDMNVNHILKTQAR